MPPGMSCTERSATRTVLQVDAAPDFRLILLMPRCRAGRRFEVTVLEHAAKLPAACRHRPSAFLTKLMSNSSAGFGALSAVMIPATTCDCTKLWTPASFAMQSLVRAG